MTTKTKLLEKINHIENDSYLQALLNYLEESEKEPIILNKSDIEAIELSNKEIKNGQTLTQKELCQKIDEWIEK